MVKTKRIRGWIWDYLKTPKTTTEIEDYISNNYKHGTNYHALINILTKDKRFMKLGVVKKAGTMSSRQNICLWGRVEV